METLEQAPGLEVQIGVRIHTASELSAKRRAPAVIDQNPSTDTDEVSAPTQAPRIREVGVELRSMIGHRVIGWIRDSSSGISLVTINGTLTALKPSDGQIILVIDGNTETAPLLPLGGITAGDVWEGTIDIRFETIEFRLYRASGERESAEGA